MIRFKMITALAATSLLASPAMADENAEPALSKGEVQLGKLLEGRVAGEPQSCIRTTSSGNLKVIDGTALVYGRGNTIYVNVPRNPKALDDNDILVIRRHNSDLCRVDIIQTRDSFSRFYNGSIMLNDFVPYTRTEYAESESGSAPDIAEG